MSAELGANPQISVMGEGGLLITLGDELSLSTNRRVHALAATLREALAGIVRDIIPAYSTLLLTFDPDRVERAELVSLVRQSMSGPFRETPLAERLVEIEVAYGGEYGPDLEAVAEYNHLASADVIDLHSAGLYHVYFLGFMPGFAYLGELDPRIAAPRLSIPRVRIPAGSVGIAGQQTGVYPLSSPGGWQIIGRTNAPLWAATAPQPSLLMPGDTVRFVPLSDLRPPAERHERGEIAAEPHSRPTFEVVSPGLFTTIQDGGRYGYAHFGVTSGGSMDPVASEMANRLVDNPLGLAVLELTWRGLELRALQTTTIALAGADLHCLIAGQAVPPGVSWLVRAGSTIRFSRPPGRRGGEDRGEGARAYLAAHGGFAVPAVLGSRSTYVPAALGGVEGRPLRAGDILGTYNAGRSPVEVAGRFAQTGATPLPNTVTLRMVRYSGYGAVATVPVDWLLATRFKVGEASDRMGVRLEGEVVGCELLVVRREALCSSPTTNNSQPTTSPSSRQRELLSFGVVRGAIQLPPGGVPTILAADHQTTGGYPIAGVVAQADWPLLAALIPGTQVELKEITLAQADQLRPSIRGSC